MGYGSDDWNDWRARRDERLRNPMGWLSLVGLHWLSATPAQFDTVPGRWSVDGDIVVVEAPAEAGLVLRDGGEAIAGERRIKPSDTHISVGRKDIELIKRGDGWALRVRDPQALTGFDGMPTFPFDEAWVVEGRFQPYEQARNIELCSVIEGLTSTDVAVGTVEFTVDGQDYSLVAFDGGDGELAFLFRDATSGTTTYAAMRALDAARPGEDGSVVLDFNRAYNMPCGLTEFATCPLPPRENILTLAVTAGERKLN